MVCLETGTLLYPTPLSPCRTSLLFNGLEKKDRKSKEREKEKDREERKSKYIIGFNANLLFPPTVLHFHFNFYLTHTDLLLSNRSRSHTLRSSSWILHSSACSSVEIRHPLNRRINTRPTLLGYVEEKASWLHWSRRSLSKLPPYLCCRLARPLRALSPPLPLPPPLLLRRNNRRLAIRPCPGTPTPRWAALGALDQVTRL